MANQLPQNRASRWETLVGTFPTGASGLIPQIRPDERRDVAGALITLFGIMVGHALLETARDALFLANLPALRLPWAYLAIAAAALVLGRFPQDLVRRMSPKHELAGWLWLASSITFAFWLLIGFGTRWVLFALYTWSGVLATLIVVRFWIALGDLFTLTQAKRLFPLVGTGSVLGAIVGSALARGLTEGLAARHVVLAAAVVFLVTSAAPRLLSSGARPQSRSLPPRDPHKMAETAQMIWERPYLRRVGAIILLATITFTLVDFVFKSVVDRTVPAENMGEFFSSVYLTVNVLALVVQFFVVSRLVRGVGVHATQMLVPFLLLTGGIGFSIGGGLALAVLLKGVDGSLRHSVYRTTTELLFIPLSIDVRSRVKPLMDVVGQRGGQALASLAILIGASLTSNEALFAVVAVGTAGAWLYLSRDIRAHYIEIFRQTLSGEITETRIEFPALDMSSLETLLSTLNVSDDRKVIAALDLLVAQGKTPVIPALILYHPSADVVVHALDIFLRSSRDDFLPIVRRLVDHPAPSVRAASVRLLSVLSADEAGLNHALDDPAAEVRLTALVGLVAGGWLPEAQAHERLDRALAETTDTARIAFAHAVHDQPMPIFERSLASICSSDNQDIQLAAIRAMRTLHCPAFIPILLELLSQRPLRRAVRGTIATFGPRVLDRLGAALRDPNVPHRIRRQLPRTIGEFPAPQVSAVLINALLAETDGMIRFKILRALGRLQTDHPGLAVDHSLLDQAIRQTVSGAFKLMQWRRSLLKGADEVPARRTRTGNLLVALVRDKQGHSLDRIFRLLDLRWNTDDFLRVHRGLQTGDRVSVASSRELLEQLVQPPLRSQLIELVDDLYDTAQPRNSRADSNAESADYQVLLCEILGSHMESLSCIAAHHVAELNMSAVMEHLRERAEFSSYHAEVVRQARHALTQQGALSG